MRINKYSTKRKVYDVLNVLVAMDIISKEGKNIKWKGQSGGVVNLFGREREELIQEIEKKKEKMKELLKQHLSLRALIESNRKKEEAGEVPVKGKKKQANKQTNM